MPAPALSFLAAACYAAFRDASARMLPLPLPPDSPPRNGRSAARRNAMSSEPGLPADALRMGRIGYLNVLPIYHPLEAGIIPHDFEIISGPPAVLNNMMARG